MSARTRRVPTRFEHETRFEVAIPAVPFRGAAEKELEQLKSRLLEGWLLESPQAELQDRYRQAATEAATLAWMTAYPLLVLPMLLDEKIREARERAERQREIRGKTRVMMAEAA